MRNKRFPKYPDDADYTTNSPSYYNDLARKQKLIQLLTEKIWDYDDEIKEYFKRWEDNLENINEDVIEMMVQWVDDGTLDHIINDTIFNWKADKTYVDSEIERLEQLDENITTYIDSEIERLEQKDEDITTQLTQIESREDIDEVYAGHFGVVADGITDDFIALRNAIHSAQGKKLVLPKGTIKISENIVVDLTDSIEIEGKNTSIELELDTFDSETHYSILNFNNQPVSHKNITRKIEKNENTLTLDDVSGLEVGQGLAIKTSEIYAHRKGFGYDYFKGFISVITHINGNEITLLDDIPHEFNIGMNLVANIYRPLSVSIKDVQLKTINETIRTSMVRLNGVFNSKIENLNLENGTVSHVYLINAYNVEFNNIRIKGNLLHNLDLNYGFYIQRATNIYLNNVKSYTLRTGTTLTGEPPSNIVFTNCHFRSHSSHSISSHCSESMVIKNSKLYNGLLLGFGSVTVFDSFIQSGSGQGVVSIREDATAFLGKIEFYNTTFNHRGTPYPDAYLRSSSMSESEYFGGFVFKGCTFNHKDGHAETVVLLNDVGTIDNFGDIIIEDCVFNSKLTYFVNVNFDHENSLDNSEKNGSMFIENNVFKEQVMVYFRGALRLFKNIYFEKNKSTSNDVVYVNSNGTGVDGEKGADVYITENIFKTARIRVVGNNGVTHVKNNTIEEIDITGAENLISTTFGNKNIILNNLFGVNSLKVENALIGWNRDFSGETPFNDLGGETIDLEV